MDKDKLESSIREEIAILMSYNINRIKTTDNLLNDLGMDEIDCSELMMTLECIFDVDMPEDAQQDAMHTVQDVVDYVYKEMERKHER